MLRGRRKTISYSSSLVLPKGGFDKLIERVRALAKRIDLGLEPTQKDIEYFVQVPYEVQGKLIRFKLLASEQLRWENTENIENLRLFEAIDRYIEKRKEARVEEATVRSLNTNFATSASICQTIRRFQR